MWVLGDTLNHLLDSNFEDSSRYIMYRSGVLADFLTRGIVCYML